MSQCKHLYLVTCLKLDICYLQMGRVWMGDKEQVGIEKKNVLWGWSYVILGNENPQLVPEGRGYTVGSLVLPFSMSVSLCLHSLYEFPTSLLSQVVSLLPPSLSYHQRIMSVIWIGAARVIAHFILLNVLFFPLHIQWPLLDLICLLDNGFLCGIKYCFHFIKCCWCSK